MKKKMSSREEFNDKIEFNNKKRILKEHFRKIRLKGEFLKRYKIQFENMENDAGFNHPTIFYSFIHNEIMTEIKIGVLEEWYVFEMKKWDENKLRYRAYYTKSKVLMGVKTLEKLWEVFEIGIDHTHGLVEYVKMSKINIGKITINDVEIE